MVIRPLVQEEIVKFDETSGKNRAAIFVISAKERNFPDERKFVYSNRSVSHEPN